jgi:hypothetical protein
LNEKVNAENQVNFSIEKMKIFEYYQGKRLFLLSCTLLRLFNRFNDRLDDTNSNGLPHITNSETAEGRIIVKFLDNHWLGGLKTDKETISVLDEFRVDFKYTFSSAVKLVIDILELGSDVRSMAIEDWSVSVLDLAGVRHDDDFSLECISSLRWIVSSVGCDVTTLDILDGDVLAIEPYDVTGDGFIECLVVHLDRLDFSGITKRSESHVHETLQDTSFDTSHRHSANTTDLVNIPNGQTKGLVSVAPGRSDKVKSFQEDGSLEPIHVSRSLNHIVADPSRDRNEVDLDRFVSNLLQVSRHF